MKSIRTFIRYVLSEGSSYELMGGLPATLKHAGAVSKDTPTKSISIDNANAYLKSHGDIFNDVESALVQSDLPGVVITDEDQYDRLVAIKGLLEKDKADGTNYPFRTALYTIAWKNGIRYFRFTAKGLHLTEEEVAKLLEEPVDSIMNSVLPESRLRKKILNEVDPVTGALAHAGLHIAGEKILPTALKAAGSFEKSEIEWLKQNLHNQDFFNYLLMHAADSPLTIPSAGVQPGMLGSAERVTKQWTTEPLIRAAVGFDPGEVRALTGKISTAIENSRLNIDQADVADALQVTVRDVIQRDKPTKDKILESMLSSSNEFFNQDANINALRKLANDAKVAQGTQSKPTAAQAAALKFFDDLAGVGERLAEFGAGKMFVPVVKRGSKILIKGAMWAALGLHSGSIFYTNANSVPADTSPATIAAIADSAKIRYEATEAQKEIVDMTDLAPAIESELLSLFDRKDNFNVDASEIAAVISQITAFEETYNAQNRLTPNEYNPDF